MEVFEEAMVDILKPVGRTWACSGAGEWVFAVIRVLHRAPAELER
jgi:hypothetical protein